VDLLSGFVSQHLSPSDLRSTFFDFAPLHHVSSGVATLSSAGVLIDLQAPSFDRFLLEEDLLTGMDVACSPY
jgi:hypothetical protein